MFVENLSYLIAFIITTGITVIGVLGTYNLFQTTKKTVIQLLLYQQIFLFSFFIYGIWGNIAIREMISDLNLNPELSGKLSLYVPVLGAPFLVVSWFMLLKFVYQLNGYGISRKIVYLYFTVFFTAFLTFGFLIQNQLIQVPVQPELYIVRLLVLVNLMVHLLLVYPVTYPKKSQELQQKKEFRTLLYLYLAGVIIYSVALSFFSVFGFISTTISVILLFAASIIIPVGLTMKPKILAIQTQKENIGFTEFCERYEISKREAEIILEICAGKSNKAIAEKLFITLQTVKDHNHRIYTKTQVSSRVQLANLVREKTGGNPED